VAVQRTDLDLDDPHTRQLAIADNRSGQVSLDWDVDTLKGLVEDGVDLAPFWTADELAELWPVTVDLQTDEDDVPPVPVEPVSKLGDLYVLGDHRLLCGDSTVLADVERLMDGQKADMVFTDPPYGINIVKVHENGYGRLGGEGGPTPFGGKKGKVGGKGAVAANWYSPVAGDESVTAALDAFNLCTSLAIPTLIFWGGNYYAYALPPAKCWIVWDKDVSGNFSECEIAYTNLEGRLRMFRHTWSGMLKESERGEKRVHPTQKPVALAVWAFNEFGEPACVLDLFGGSGSTLIACEKTGRKCYMMELSPQYCDVIVTRWEQATGKKAVLSAG
jgi:DNA modification methylase